MTRRKRKEKKKRERERVRDYKKIRARKKIVRGGRKIFSDPISFIVYNVIHYILKLK